MSERRARARASEASFSHGGALLDRRTFLTAALALGLAPRRLLAAEDGSTLPEATRRALAGSPFVYVSPLRSDGRESTCHGEVWYAWLDGRVALVTGTDRWKARSVARGLDRARIWVGDFGRWKRGPFENDAFRQGPSFDARATTSKDPALLERMLEQYEGKYPDEIGTWRERFRQGLASGERVLVLYEPLG